MRLGQSLGLLAFAISLYIFWQIRKVVLLLFAAVVLATVLNRVVKELQRYQLKRGIAITITIVFLLLPIIGFFALIVLHIVDQLQQLVAILPKAFVQLQSWVNWIQILIPGQMLDNIPILVILTQKLEFRIASLLSDSIVILKSSLTAVLGLLLLLVLTIMLLANFSQYQRVFILAFPAFYRQRVDEILSKCENSLFNWIRGTLMAMLVISVLSFFGLSILGMPLPLVNATLAGFLEIIPNIGLTLSVLPPLLLALLDAPWKASAVLVLYIIIQQFESLFLVPLLVKQTVDLQPAFTILAVVAFASLFGFLGLFVAIPLLIVCQIWLKEVLVKDVFNTWQRNAK